MNGPTLSVAVVRLFSHAGGGRRRYYVRRIRAVRFISHLRLPCLRMMLCEQGERRRWDPPARSERPSSLNPKLVSLDGAREHGGAKDRRRSSPAAAALIRKARSTKQDPGGSG